MRKIKPEKPLDPNGTCRFISKVRWSCGITCTHFGRFEIVCYMNGMEVIKLGPFRQPDEWWEWFPRRRFEWRLLAGERPMALKWIKAALAKRKTAKATALPADDLICKGRPALTEFMTETEGPSGGYREPSAIMFSFSERGVRVGLKDDDMGGWCWREGSTFQEGLDAVEKALQAGEGAFRAPRAQGKKKR